MYCAYIIKNKELDLDIPTLELYYAMPALVAMYNGRLEIEGKPHINSVNELAIFPTTIEIMTHPRGLLVVLWSHNGAGEETVDGCYGG
jgi:hypothetical protein